jgi:hypothetical protein
VEGPVDPGASGYDRTAASSLLARVLALPGGPGLVTASLARIPGAEERQARGGFGSRVAGVELGAWRFTPATGTRLLVAHVVGGIAISEEPLLPVAAAQRVAGAMEEHLANFGPQILPDVLAVLEGLAVASG